jgi:putative glutamine amidotransferase
VIAVPHWRAATWERTKFYYDSLVAAGGNYLVVREPDLPAQAKALLLTGGVDVNPRLYGEKRQPGTNRPNLRRDEHELSLLRQAMERDMPVLCICRGHQLLNVALGGTILQDIDGAAHKWNEDSSSSRWHEVTVAPGTRLADAYGSGTVLRVNSRHHQGITRDGLAPKLEVTAVSPDGFVEAIESVAHRWVVGVQWHPERPEMRPEAGALFESFVQACGG